MSWEEHETKLICPCGQGFYISRSRTDDWGRYEDKGVEMICEKCKSKYEWKCVRRVQHPGKENVYDWVKKKF